MNLNDIVLFEEKINDFDFLEVNDWTRIYYKYITKNNYSEISFVVISRYSYEDGFEDWKHQGSELAPSFFGLFNHRGVYALALSSGENPILNRGQKFEFMEDAEYENIGKALLALEKLEAIFDSNYQANNPCCK